MELVKIMCLVCLALLCSFCIMTSLICYQACPTFFAAWATSAKFGLYAGKMKFNTEHLECINIQIIIYTFICIFLYIIYNKNILIIV
jgi:hypothetical protein